VERQSTSPPKPSAQSTGCDQRLGLMTSQTCTFFAPTVDRVRRLALRPEVVVLARRDSNESGPYHDELPLTGARLQLPIEASSMGVRRPLNFSTCNTTSRCRAADAARTRKLRDSSNQAHQFVSVIMAAPCRRCPRAGVTTKLY
jgi:hypothetical protein